MATRFALLIALAATLAACSPSAGVDASTDAPLDPTSLHAPDLACGTDTGVALDPCAHMVVCVGSDGTPSPTASPAFAVTYFGGSCVAGQCAFTAPPTIEPCMNGCFGGPSGRCTGSGPTAL